ncbi:keratin, type I cytoskeletal 9-like [Stegodyphus dumicola]|uniref:keratin, type I cytoskeletal 9-like n=1 Tax=Stegodyphus dumicola TaxID=202533 RepID=UPI0015AF9ECC|nr:keratin, type I cytoskeletal 9-like [Stegodyphus dumicola]
MNQLFILVAVVAAFANAKEEPFSIGLGTLSPSYRQTVGKENVKVNVEQRDDGFSYSVGDPRTGTNTYLNFGGASAGQAVNPAGYASGYGASAGQAINPAGYASGHGASAGQAINPAGYASGLGSGYGSLGASVNPGAYSQMPSISPGGYGGSVSSQYGSPSAYGGLSGLPSPSYGSNSGLAGYGGPSGQSGLYSGPASVQGGYGSSSPVGASGFYGSSNLEAARKPEDNPAPIIPAGFSYHGTEGQAFLRQGDSPNFVISDDNKGANLGPAQRSFQTRGGLPVGGYAGPQHSGTFKEQNGYFP